jgi:hypothetical protein
VNAYPDVSLHSVLRKEFCHDGEGQPSAISLPHAVPYHPPTRPLTHHRAMISQVAAREALGLSQPEWDAAAAVPASAVVLGKLAG